ncbi:MAG: UvrD-helicase domain-containing protein [Candidatus Liptonbacteria bacterium]|nr:UvrD-helicase domain-containing protein [Candidatus Liptonbacteria bacterium]
MWKDLEKSRGVFEALNKDQKKAVFAPEKPLLIVAGAGTGKTKTLTSRLIHLILKGVPSNKICALTFTNKAAREMEERVANNLQRTTDDGQKAVSRSSSVVSQKPSISTFHSLGARILRKEAKRLKRGFNFGIFDDDDSLRLVKKIAKDKLPKKTEAKPALIYEKISAIKNGMIELESLKNSKDINDEMAFYFFPIYEKALEENNAFDFDDLIQKVVGIFKNHPEILGRYQDQFSYVLVDEYQDINNVQYELIKLLAKDGKGLSVVGDDQQTIYSWRGSNIGIFLSFEKDWPEAQVMLLDQNYRSTQNIIHTASELIKNNQFQITHFGSEKKEKNLWTKNEGGEKVTLREFSNEDEEAGWISNEVLGDRLKVKGGEKKESIGILYRTNAQSRAIEQALIERELPYVIFGGVKFYDRFEIKDILAALRYYFNPKDSLSRERLEKNIGKRRFFDFQERIMSLENLEPAELVGAFLKTTDYFKMLEKSYTNFNERRENIAELTVFATQFKDLGEFLEKVSLVQAHDLVTSNKGYETSKEGEVVSLMTIHLAKGLEFDRVFLAGASEGILPHHRSIDTLEKLEEERRLTYVALTRARKKIHISFYDIPSRFLSELPIEVLDYAALDGKNFEDEERYITLD